jgi:hypothetical protein
VAIPERSRRLIGNVWQYVTASENGGGGDISEVVADDASVTVTNGTGPVVGLSANGGSQPVQAMYSGSPVSIPDGQGAPLTFDTLDSGTELLDRTNPAAPELLAAGTYAFTGSFYASAPLTAGGHTAFNVSTSSGPTSSADTLHPDFVASASLVFVGEAGDSLLLSLNNIDGAASRDFSMYGAVLVKLA